MSTHQTHATPTPPTSQQPQLPPSPQPQHHNPPSLKISALLTTFIHLPFHTVFQDCFDSHYPDSAGSYVPVLNFLLEHPGRKDGNDGKGVKGEKVLFDLGVRKNASGYPPNIPRVTQSLASTSALKDVSQLLSEGGIDPAEINHIVYSHLHWDHTGDPEPFVNADIVVGGEARGVLGLQGARAGVTRRNGDEAGEKEEKEREQETWVYPTNPLGTVLEFPKGMPVRFVDFEGVEKEDDEKEEGDTNDQGHGRWRVISPFKTFTHAVDFFGDGSLYLVNTPGHYPGHISALARVSSSNTEDGEGGGGTYVFLGGDCCHNRQCYVPGGTRRKLSGKIQWDVEKARVSVGRVSMLCGICQGRYTHSEGNASDDVVDLDGKVHSEGESGDDVRDVVVILAHEAERLEEGMPLFPQDLGEWAVHRAKKERLRGGR